MTTSIILLGGICIMLIVALTYVLAQHEKEREAWAAERKQLVDRAIARHAGEVLALDREPKKPKGENDQSPPIFVEGLS